MATFATKKVEKGGTIKYYCETCDYYANRNDLFNKHLLTGKHFRNALATKKVEKVEKVVNEKFMCTICSKIYLSKSGLWRHKQKCNYQNLKNTESYNKNLIDVSQNHLALSSDLILEVVKQQQNQINELTNTIKELIPKVGNNNITTNNQKFNIQVFLNEQCKDAINMSDFIKSIEVSLQQLDYTKQNGLINGLSNIIIENINKLGLYERPIYCTDTKRETLYIKDDDVWQKDANKQKIKKAIKNISTKQFSALNNWTKENPDFQNDEHKQNYYTHALVAIANNKEDNEDKIIKKLCNTSYIKD